MKNLMLVSGCFRWKQLGMIGFGSERRTTLVLNFIQLKHRFTFISSVPYTRRRICSPSPDLLPSGLLEHVE
jgi:hypothetical protein